VTDMTLPPLPTAHDRRRLVIGYAVYLTAACLFALNGTIVKTILLSGVSAARLSEIRATGAFLILFVVVLIARPRALRIQRGEWGLLLAYGVIGVAMTQFLFFVAIERMPIGIALVIEFTAPIFVVLYARFGRRELVRSTVWIGLALALVGLAFIAQVWQGFVLNGVGVLAAFGAALALALFYVMAEQQRRSGYQRDALSLTMWGMAGSAAFWAIAQPWWSFPWADFAGLSEPLAGSGPQLPLSTLTTWMIVMGTALPFTLIIVSLAYITAAQASIVGMLEPVIASIIAWIALAEVLTPTQIIGGLVVLAGVYLAERGR